MEHTEYRIPLEYTQGTYDAAALPQGEQSLTITRTDFGALDYRHPVTGTDIRVYNVPEDAALTAEYRKNGALTWVYFQEGTCMRLVYMPPDNMTHLLYADIAAKAISTQILTVKEPVSRLFFTWFYDGDAVDIAVCCATSADLEALRVRYGAETAAVDNSGDYPQKKHLRYDLDLLRMILLCAEPENRARYLRETVDCMQRWVTGDVVPKLQKAPDFRIIAAEEYD